MAKNNSKPPLLFIHGFRGAPSGVKEIAEQFPEYKVFIPYIPPSGEQSLKKYDIENYTDFLKAYIEKNKIKKPILIGHSMGSIIAAAFAEKYPKLISNKLILLAPIVKKVAKPIVWLSPLTAILPSDLVSFITNKFLFVPHKNPKLYKHTMALAREGAQLVTSKKDVAKSAFFSVSHTVNEFQLSQKILVVTGKKDRIMPQKATRAFAKKTDSKVIFLSNSGHLVNYEQPAKTAQAIRAFLEQ